MKNKILRSLFFLGCLTVFVPALASQDFGEIAEGLFVGSLAIRNIIRAICIISGTFFVFGSFLLYRKHRQNPTEIPISRVIISFLAGVGLIILSFIPMQLK